MNYLPRKILVIGGGTTGWMTACYLARAHELQCQRSSVHVPCEITLLESSTIGTIGVGEGSTPYIRQFFAFLGIAEAAWMPACSATFKMGINFENWNNKRCNAHPAETSSYFHPFFSELDIPTANHYFDAVNQRRKGVATDVNPSHYFTAAEMVKQRIAPTDINPGVNLDYAYHFDAGLLGEYLKSYAIGKQVVHKVGSVINVEADSATHTIQSVITDNQGTLNAELFIDCSGFSGVLGKKALKRPFTSFADTLFNDAAVAIATPSTETHSYQTRSVALKHGWQWEIPLTSRVGNGYVYSTQFCDPSEAEQELRDTLNTQANARHLRMEVGRLTEHWQGNCLTIGLAQGFIEPLEATALMLVQYTIEHFVDYWQSDMAHSQAHVAFNKEINRMFDGIKDYIAAHYYLNTRQDTAYWQACRHDIRVPETLAYLLKAWDSGASFETALNEVDNQLVYLRPSWYCIFAGMQRFSQPREGHAITNEHAQFTLRKVLAEATGKKR